MKEKLLLVGNANVGKTSLFNMLTNSFEHTGNWHGVTIDAKEKLLKIEDKMLKVVDLPGLYSLTSFSFEEESAINYLYQNKDSFILNICDSNVLNRNLYLTLQLIELGLSPVLFLNFAKEARNKDIRLNMDKLQSMLGLRAVEGELKNFKKSEFDLNFFKIKAPKTSVILPYLKELPIEEISKIIKYKKNPLKLTLDYLSIKILEEDDFIIKYLNLTQNEKSQIEKIQSKKDFKLLVAGLRYDYIDRLMLACRRMPKREVVYGKFFIDKIILNRFLCLPIFLCILFLIFYLTFSSVGAYLSGVLKKLIDNFIGIPGETFLIKINAPVWVIGLFSSAIISGVGGLLSFIPQIVLLFLFLSILEDSGYMSRLAFSFEDLFYSIGLSGKSIFTVLMSFGCATTAVLTARNIEDKNARIKTAIISPYMSCSAKLPIYAVIGGAFFGGGNIFLIVALYLLGVIVGVLVSLLLGKFLLKSGERSFILEFPPYRVPSLRRVLFLIYNNCKLFLIKVGSLILSMSVIVWILQNFSFNFSFVTDLKNTSMLTAIGEFLSPLFSPIGLGSWGIVASLLIGFVAKEMVVSSMAIINKIPSADSFDKQLGLSFIAPGFAIGFSPITAVIMMIFSLLYCPCASTVGVLKKEIGLKYTLLACVIQFLIAYFICFIVYNVAAGTAVARIIAIILFIILILFSFIFLFLPRNKKCKKQCKFCNFCVNK